MEILRGKPTDNYPFLKEGDIIELVEDYTDCGYLLHPRGVKLKLVLSQTTGNLCVGTRRNPNSSSFTLHSAVYKLVSRNKGGLGAFLEKHNL